MEKQLRDGLILRSFSAGYQSDRDRILDFYNEIYSASEQDGWTENDAFWAKHLLSGQHPTVSFDDIWVVIDPTKDDMIVSTTMLIPQTWSYEDVTIPMGRPELVATHPDYRRRGLIRTLMEVCHARSAELGHKLLGITGIPYYYRRFGYTMAVNLGAEGRLQLNKVPSLKEDETPEYSLRDAVEADYAQMSAWNKSMAPEFSLSVVRDDALWGWQTTMNGPVHQIIVDADGDAVGYLSLFHNAAHGDDSSWMHCASYMVGEKSSYLASFQDVMRGIKGYAESVFEETAQPPYLSFMASQPPALRTLISRSYGGQVFDRTYAWYLRVPDLPDFIMTIKPVLERRLDRSGAHRYTGPLKISLYNQSGLQIDFVDGCVQNASITDLSDPLEEQACDAGFPEEYFLHLLFGYRSWEELRHVITECRANGKATVLFDALFPIKPAHIFAV